jgi:hypothetical protein
MYLLRPPEEHFFNQRLSVQNEVHSAIPAPETTERNVLDIFQLIRNSGVTVPCYMPVMDVTVDRLCGLVVRVPGC